MTGMTIGFLNISEGFMLCRRDTKRKNSVWNRWGICRNSVETTEIIIGMRSLFGLMKSENALRCGSLMEEVVHYLDHFRNRFFPLQKWWGLHDRQQSCRAVYQIAGKWAEKLAVYTILLCPPASCGGYPILEYLKNFFEAITAGNCDYGKHMSLNHRHNCKQIVKINRILF